MLLMQKKVLLDDLDLNTSVARSCQHDKCLAATAANNIAVLPMHMVTDVRVSVHHYKTTAAAAAALFVAIPSSGNVRT